MKRLVIVWLRVGVASVLISVASATSLPAEPAAQLGSIAGTVAFRGTPPGRKPLKRDTDPVCAANERLDERVVVTDGKLRGVHVRIQSGTAGKHRAPAQPVVVNQLDCMYAPRVVGVMEGQPLHVRNSDPTYHNVRGTKHKHTEWNLGQPPSAPAIVRENVGKAGEVLTLRCDVHPWMRAYAVVTDHPYFDVTAQDGAFSLPQVPPGRYVIEAWHPELGLKQTSVTVKPDAATSIEIAFP